jgi:restriction system protein
MNPTLLHRRRFALAASVLANYALLQETEASDDEFSAIASVIANAAQIQAAPHQIAYASTAPPSEATEDARRESALDIPELPILVQAIVEVHSKSSEGALVQTIGPIWRKLLRLLAVNPEVLRELTPRQLEEVVAASYEEEGFEEVTLTPRSGDLGRDVIAVKRGFCTVRVIDQVKHFAPEHRVAANDVRALIGVLLSDERATKGVVTTTSRFAPGIATDPFIAKHVPFRLELVDGSQLVKRLTSYLGASR